jgi:PLD-like domain
MQDRSGGTCISRSGLRTKVSRLAKANFLSEGVWEKISELTHRAKSRQVAVAYIGSDALDMLPLGKGDTLIVDLSDGAVKSGSTDPSVIRRYFHRGVNVFSYRGLHAKVFVFDDTAVIGSTNVSSNSRDRLTEAAVLTSDPGIVQCCLQFIEELRKELNPLDKQQIAEKEKIYRKPKWTPGSDLPKHQTRADWADKVIQTLKMPLGNRKRHGRFIDLAAFSDSVATAYLALDPADRAVGTARLDLYPADIVTQARPFYLNVDPARLIALRTIDWTVKANLHFGNSWGQGLHPNLTHQTAAISKYIKYWQTHEGDIRRFDQSELWRQIKKLQTEKIMPRVVAVSEFARLKKNALVDIRPGVRLTFQWSFGNKLPSPTAFASKVRSKIDEALQTWGDSLQ